MRADLGLGLSIAETDSRMACLYFKFKFILFLDSRPAISVEIKIDLRYAKHSETALCLVVCFPAASKYDHPAEIDQSKPETRV